MKAEIISTGTELLMGETLDTNSSYLAGELIPLGIELYWVTQVADYMPRMLEALERAWARSDLIITTGGLGPTDGDLTREAIAAMLGEELTVDPALESEIRDLFRKLGFQMASCNIKQAYVIPSAKPITNPRGSAPGWWVERDGRILLAMPGPPREMQNMWQKSVIPRLRQRLGGTVILTRTIKIFGLPEATANEMVAPLLSSSNPTWGIYAKPEGVQVRLIARGSTEEETARIAAEAEANIRKVIGDQVWGTDKDTLEGVVGMMLAERHLSLSVMESCTAGLLASTITDVANSSSYFRGGLVAYSDEVKIALGIDAELIAKHGTASLEVAKAMASVARQRFDADIGVSINGPTGTGGGEGSHEMVYIAIDDSRSKKVTTASSQPRRADIKHRAVTTALFTLRQALLSSDRADLTSPH